LAADPKKMSHHYRKLVLVHTNVLHGKMRDPAVPVSQRLQFAEFLAKIGDAVPKATAMQSSPGAGFSVNIVFGNSETPQVTTKDMGTIELVDTPSPVSTPVPTPA
jgi:hypothetical protein